MCKIPKQRYTVEFTQEAVRQVEVEGKNPAQVARELGIAEQTLSNIKLLFCGPRALDQNSCLKGN